MGMSSSLVGVRPPDAKWLAMKAAWEACEKAGVAPPTEVEEFFNGEKPDPLGVVIGLQQSSAVREYAPHDAAEGYEVDLTKLPKDVTVLRFWNSW
jgi:hypothetical protein